MIETERAGLPIESFPDDAAWEAWLAAQPRTSTGIWLKLAKAGNAESMLTKPQAIDGALIHGWIDGRLDPFDDRWWLIRFTPRKPRSKWSEKNRLRASALIADGRMAQAGRSEVDVAKADGRWAAAYPPPRTAAVPDDLRSALDADPGACDFFDTLTGANRYAILYRIHDARRPETQAARIAKFLAMCAAGETVSDGQARPSLTKLTANSTASAKSIRPKTKVDTGRLPRT